MIVDGELDVEFLDERFEAVPFGHALGLDDDELGAEQLGQFEKLPIFRGVERGMVDAEDV